jgi:protein-S-isoprenylcysteine O-methyltransferase Ste14
VLSMTLRTNPTNRLFLQTLSLFGQGLGLVAMLFSLLCLGKSFGIVPANRAVKIRGAYAFIRHPLYASEAIFYLGFLVGHFDWLNLLKIFLVFLGQLWRIRSEECVLNRDPCYREYCRRVPHRLLPGIF